MSTPTPLAEQQKLIAEAIAKLEADPTCIEYGALRLDTLRYAHADHDGPDGECLADPGKECIAVELARKVLAA